MCSLVNQQASYSKRAIVVGAGTKKWLQLSRKRCERWRIAHTHSFSVFYSEYVSNIYVEIDVHTSNSNEYTVPGVPVYVQLTFVIDVVVVLCIRLPLDIWMTTIWACCLLTCTNVEYVLLIGDYIIGTHIACLLTDIGRVHGSTTLITSRWHISHCLTAINYVHSHKVMKTVVERTRWVVRIHMYPYM